MRVVSFIYNGSLPLQASQTSDVGLAIALTKPTCDVVNNYYYFISFFFFKRKLILHRMNLTII